MRVPFIQGGSRQFKQLQTLHALRSVRDFLDRNELDVRMGPLAPHIATLTSSINRLESLVVEQEARWKLGRAGTSAKNRLARSVVLECLRPVARMAPALFKLPAYASRSKERVSLAYGRGTRQLKRKSLGNT